MIRHSGIHRAQQRHPLGDDRVDVEVLGMHLRLAREFRECPHAPLERLDFADDDLDGLVHERAGVDVLGGRLPRLHLLDGQPDRRQRVLQLVRGLARQRLPARHARQVDEPLAALLELVRHVIEGGNGPAHLVARRGARFPARLQPARPVAAGEIRQRRGELLDRPAHAVGEQHQRQQRDEPRGAEQHEQRQREAPPQIARIDLAHETARLSKLGGQLLHADAAQVTAVDLDATHVAGTVRAPHVVHALAARRPTRRSAQPHRSPRTSGRARATRPRSSPRVRVGRVCGRRARPASARRVPADRTASRWSRASARVDRARRSSHTAGCGRGATS